MHKPSKNLTERIAGAILPGDGGDSRSQSDNFASLPGRSQKRSSSSSSKWFGDSGVADLLHDGTRNHG